jgi:Tol biopolymer transport system component/imidazolonepropionase-like amidohydrolase
MPGTPALKTLPAALCTLAAACTRVTADPTVALLPLAPPTREIDFTTDEGTWMSVDISPDGRWLVFDLLGQVYRLPAEGGAAEPLTENSGAALNYHPRFSPDGRTIAFISDRSGQDNVWLMNADGANPRPVYPDPRTRYREPAWTPDGTGLLVSRFFQRMHNINPEIWLLPVAGGEPRRMLSRGVGYHRWPSMTPDGKRVFYFTAYPTGNNIGATEDHFIQSVDLATGTSELLRPHPGKEAAPTANPYAAQNEASRRRFGRVVRIPELGTAELAPEVSPDGRRVAFGMQLAGTTQEYRGHTFGPRTGLMVRHLETGEERVVVQQLSIDLTRANRSYIDRVLPGYAWAKDGRSIVYSEGGKLRRVDVATGAITTIPFTARVRRRLARQPRNQTVLSPDSFAVRYLQWPTAAADGRLAFGAAGSLWLSDATGSRPRPRPRPRPLTPYDPASGFAYTPAWSPDGRWVAYTTWHDSAGGHVWKVDPGGGTPVRLSTEPARYLHPAWTADGREIVVARAQGRVSPERWMPNEWGRHLEEEDRWSVVRLPASGGAATTVIAAAQPEAAPRVSGDGAVSVYAPIAGGVGIVTVAAGPRPDTIRILPPVGLIVPTLRQPSLSPDGKWIAYDAERVIYLVPVPERGAAARAVPANPADTSVRAIRISPGGGVDHRWRRDGSLEYANGDRYETYDPATQRHAGQTIGLTLPRPIPRGTLVLRGARLITVDHAGIVERGDVVVRDGRIACVGRCDVTGADRTIDLTGKVIIPGLIDVHEHVTFRLSDLLPRTLAAAAVDLAYGITTLYDPASASEAVFPLSAIIDAGRIIGPRVYSTGEPLWGTFHEVGSVATLDAARRAVNRRVDWGALGVKPYRIAHRGRQQLLVEAARERGVTVTAEGGSLYDDVGYALDGQTGWEHFIPPIPLFRDATTFFGRAGVVHSPTVHIAGHLRGSVNYFRPRHDLPNDRKYARFVPRASIEFSVQGDSIVPDHEFSFPLVAEGLKDIIRAGGYGAVGAHGEQPGVGTHWELWSYASALTPLEAITIATLHGAYFLGLDRHLGSLRTGKLADLVVLNSDPLRDIRNSLDIAFVMKGGVLYDDDELRVVWDGSPNRPIAPGAPRPGPASPQSAGIRSTRSGGSAW